MIELETLLAFLGGILIRFGIPIVFTIIVVYLLRRLDSHWLAEAQQKPVYAPAPDQLPCRDVKGCSSEKRTSCPAYGHMDQPCWQFFRAENGYLKEACLDCSVFRNAPIPQHKPLMENAK